MKKKDFTDLICAEMAKGGKRFCVSVTAYGEAVLYWTNAKGVRVWRVLSGNRERPANRQAQPKEDSGIPALAEQINGSQSPVRTGLLGSLHVQNAEWFIYCANILHVL